MVKHNGDYFRAEYDTEATVYQVIVSEYDSLTRLWSTANQLHSWQIQIAIYDDEVGWTTKSHTESK